MRSPLWNAKHGEPSVFLSRALGAGCDRLRMTAAPDHGRKLTLGAGVPVLPEGEAIVKDYESLGLTLRRHPLALLRPQLQERALMTAADLEDAPDRRQVKACGLVTTRQQPETANGTIFISLEDETGEVQVIVHRAIWERQRQETLSSRLLAVREPGSAPTG